MSVLFAEIDRNNSVASASLNGCGGSVHNPQVQPQNKEQTNSLAAVAAAAAAANSLEEQRALQLAFELSMLGLSDSLSGCNGNGVVGSDLSVNIGLNGVNSGCHQSPSSLSPGGSAGGGMNSVISNNVGLNAFSSMMPSLEDRSKKSQNMTECVPVPSSEHVAEIVGRQGKLNSKRIFTLFLFKEKHSFKLLCNICQYYIHSCLPILPDRYLQFYYNIFVKEKKFYFIL